MPYQDVAHAAVSICPPDRRTEAMMSLAAAHSTTHCKALENAIVSHKTAQGSDWDGLLVLDAKAITLKATWVQPLQAGMAQLWRPRGCHDVCQRLLEAAHRAVLARAMTVCHTTLAPHERYLADTLVKAGMCRVAPLAYMTCPLDRLPLTRARTRLNAWQRQSSDQQAELLTRIQEASLDCPLLTEALGSEALLAGFRAQDAAPGKHWHSVHLGEGAPPVGVLLLAERPAHGALEVMLMGLVPECRGRGLGREVLACARKVAAATGAQRLILSVDITNLPAMALYRQAGFVVYFKEDIYAWLG